MIATETLDGVRALWDGQALFTRGGHRIHAPAWFTAGLPAFALVCELWAGYDTLRIANALWQASPNHAAWPQARLLVFDVPDAPGGYVERMAGLPARITPHCRPVSLHPVASNAEMFALLDSILARGGQGFVMRPPALPYRRGTVNFEMLKVKYHWHARLLKRLRLHGWIKKVGKTYKYYLTELGRRAVLVGLKLKEHLIVPDLATASA